MSQLSRRLITFIADVCEDQAAGFKVDLRERIRVSLADFSMLMVSCYLQGFYHSHKTKPGVPEIDLLRRYISRFDEPQFDKKGE